MPKDPTRSSAIYASDLLGIYGMNADKLDGLDSDQFLRSDVTSFPLVDDEIDLGSTTRRFHRIFVKELWGIESINGEDFSLYMKRNQHNIPTVNSDGTTGFDFGSINNWWRTIYARTANFETIYADNLVTSTGELYSHTKLKDIGTNTHPQIDNHINTRTVTNLSTNVHGATWNNTPNTIIARDASGNIWVNNMYGTAHRALWADLAEKYTAKEKAPIGTVYCVSTDKDYDVEICMVEASQKVIGVVSENPAFCMNDGIDGVQLGLKGKLDVRVIGPVNKGDILISAGNGCARAAHDKWLPFKFAIANETNLEDKEKLIKAIL